MLAKIFILCFLFLGVWSIAYIITKLVFYFWDKVSIKLEVNRKKRLFELNYCINELENIKAELKGNADLEKIIDSHISKVKGAYNVSISKH